MKLSEKWSVQGGNGDFVLVERRKGKNPKTGQPTVTEHKTYHPSLEQCAAKIAKVETIEAMEIESISEVLMTLINLERQISEWLNHKH